MKNQLTTLAALPSGGGSRAALVAEETPKALVGDFELKFKFGSGPTVIAPHETALEGDFTAEMWIDRPKPGGGNFTVLAHFDGATGKTRFLDVNGDPFVSGVSVGPTGIPGLKGPDGPVAKTPYWKAQEPPKSPDEFIEEVGKHFDGELAQWHKDMIRDIMNSKTVQHDYLEEVETPFGPRKKRVKRSPGPDLILTKMPMSNGEFKYTYLNKE